MKPILICLLLWTVSAALAQNQTATNSNTSTNASRRGNLRPLTDVKYEHGADSKPKEGVPKGTVTDYVWKDSKVFPGTIRRWSIYVPAQYDESKPAALMVFQDGHTYLKPGGDFRVPVVFDNLIAAKEDRKSVV